MKRSLKLLLLGACLNSFAQNEVSVGYRPMGFVNFDPQYQSINLTENSDKGNCPVIDIDNFQDGFRTSKLMPYSIQLGAAAGWWFPIAGQWLSVGLGLSKESYIEFFYNSKDEEDLKADKKRKLPFKAAELISWDAEDAVYFDSMGGVLATVGTGVPPFMVGVTARIEAGWAHYIEKIDGQNNIFISMRRRKVKDILFGNGISQIGAALARSAEQAKGFAYQIKLEKDDVKEAYELMMKGDVRKMQELAEQERVDVLKLDDTKWQTNRKYGFVGLGVPYFPILAIGASYNKEVQNNERETTWEAFDDVYKGIYSSERMLRLIIGHRTLRKQFTVERKFESKMDWANDRRVETTNYSGLFEYQYQSDMNSENDIERIVRKLQKKTLLEDKLCVTIPKIDGRTKFRRVHLKMNLKDQYVRLLQKEDAVDKINSFAQQVLTDKQLKKLDKDFKRLANKLKKAREHFEQDHEKFSREMSLVGKLIWNNPELFNTFYQLGKNCGLSFDYEVAGKRLSRHLVSEDFDYSAACELN